jgi:hypothetical protein
MATAKEQLLSMMNPQQARLMDQQLRNQQVAQRAQGAGMLSGLVQAYTGMGDIAQRATGIAPMGAMEQQAIQRQQMKAKEEQQKLLKTEREKQLLMGKTPEQLNAIYRNALAAGNEGLANKAKAIADSYPDKMPIAEKLRLAKELEMSVSQLDEAIRTGAVQGIDFTPKPKVDMNKRYSLASKIAKDHNVSIGVVMKAMETGDFSALPAPAVEQVQQAIQSESVNSLDVISEVLRVPVDKLGSIYDKKTLSKMTSTVAMGTASGASSEQVMLELIGIAGGEEGKGSTPSGSPIVVDMAKITGMPANILQNFDANLLAEVQQFALQEQQKPNADLDRIRVDAIGMLTSSAKSSNTPTHPWEKLSLTKNQWEAIPTHVVLKANSMFAMPLDVESGETESSRLARINAYIAEQGGADTGDKEIPLLMEIAGVSSSASLDDIYSSGSLVKANKARLEGYKEGETKEQFSQRIGSLLQVKANKSVQKRYDELRQVNSNWNVSGVKTVSTAYGKIPLAFTDFIGSVFLYPYSRATGFNKESVTATQYLNRINADITLGKADQMSGALSDKDILFLKQIAGDTTLTAESLATALEELFVQRQTEAALYTAMNQLRSRDMSEFNNFDENAYLNNVVTIGGIEGTMRSHIERNARAILRRGIE